MKHVFTFNVDKALKRLGFEKVREDKRFIVQYERDTKYGYVQCLDLCHKASGKHLIQSYQKDVNSEGFNNSVGFTPKEAKLAVKKMRKCGWR